MKKLQTKQSGFTLIELIVVIVILGIMSAVAVPQFIDLQTDARISVADGIEGSIRSGATLAYSKALIDGNESGSSSVTTQGGPVTTEEGYPTGDAAGIGVMVDIAGSNVAVGYAGTTATYTIDGVVACTVTYTEPAAAGAPPVIANNASAANC